MKKRTILLAIGLLSFAIYLTIYGPILKYKVVHSNQITKQIYFTNLFGEITGDVLTYDTLGHLTIMSHYRRGVKNGSDVRYYPGGNIKSKSNWKNGIRDGGFYEFYNDGNLKSKSKFKNGVVLDTVTIFHKNGSLKETQVYNNGELDGLTDSFDSLGNKETTIYFKEGNKNIGVLYEKEGMTIYFYKENSTLELSENMILDKITEDTISVKSLNVETYNFYFTDLERFNNDIKSLEKLNFIVLDESKIRNEVYYKLYNEFDCKYILFHLIYNNNNNNIFVTKFSTKEDISIRDFSLGLIRNVLR